MANTNFIDGSTVIMASWLNDLNLIAYQLLGNAGTPPATRADILTNLGISGGSYLVAANNLSDLVDAATARTNLGLGTLAVQSTALVANGGTGQTSYTDGQLLIGNGGTLSKGTLTAGAGIGITNAGGSITVTNTALGAGALGALVKLAGLQSISNNIGTAVTWDNIQYDTSSIWSVGAPTYLTVPAGVSKIRLQGFASFVANATGSRGIAIVASAGSAFSSVMFLAGSAAFAADLTAITPVIQTSPGVQYYLSVQQDSGGALNLNSNAWFSMEIIG